MFLAGICGLSSVVVVAQAGGAPEVPHPLRLGRHPVPLLALLQVMEARVVPEPNMRPALLTALEEVRRLCDVLDLGARRRIGQCICARLYISNTSPRSSDTWKKLQRARVSGGDRAGLVVLCPQVRPDLRDSGAATAVAPAAMRHRITERRARPSSRRSHIP